MKRKEQDPVWRLSDFNVKANLATDVCAPVMLSYTSVEPRCEKKRILFHRTENTQIRLHIRAVWPVHLIFDLSYMCIIAQPLTSKSSRHGCELPGREAQRHVFLPSCSVTFT